MKVEIGRETKRRRGKVSVTGTYDCSMAAGT